MHVPQPAPRKTGFASQPLQVISDLQLIRKFLMLPGHVVAIAFRFLFNVDKRRSCFTPKEMTLASQVFRFLSITKKC